MEVPEIKNSFKELFDQFKAYTQIRSTLLTLQFKKVLLELIATAVSSLLVIIFLFFCLLFGSFSAAYYIGELCQNSFTGFLYVAAFYFILALVLLLFRKSIQQRMSTILIKILFKEDDDE